MLVDKHGTEAPICSAMKADAMLENGDMDGAATWRRVVKAVEALLDTEPRDRLMIPEGPRVLILASRQSIAARRKPLAGGEKRRIE